MMQTSLLAYTAGATIAVAVVARMWLRRRRRVTADRLVVAITGCDSGVGYSAALHCHSRGFTVVASVLNIESSGAQDLTRISQISERLEVVRMDVTQPEQVSNVVQRVTSLLDNNKDLVFHGLINNAGVMVFGETEWQTERTTSVQIEVNLTGTIRVTRMFAPLLRKYKGRVINITSHCSHLPLPGLSVYAGTKAGLQAWSDALRVEWAKYGVSVISLLPGAFFQQTNILSKQNVYAQEMEEGMSEEAKSFYSSYYQEYQSYLEALSGKRPAVAIQCVALYRMLDSALLDQQPRTHYRNSPWRYSLYHTLAAIAPIGLRDILVTRFTGMPKFQPEQKMSQY